MKLERPRLRPRLLRRDVEQELLIYDPSSGETLLLNATAAAIAELCDGATHQASIVREILAVVDADPEVVRVDVDRIIGELAERGFLEEG